MNCFKFSIIIPVYNTEKYLKECVDSILSQTFDNFEIILVDDGSSDNSPNICDEYKSLYKEKIEVIHKENEGQLASRIRGLESAKGEYIYYVDSDDTIESNLLNDVNKVINSYKSDIVLLNFQYIDEIGKIVEINNDDIQSGSIKKETVFDFIVKEKINPLWRKIFKKDLFDKNIDFKKYYHIKNGEDLIQSLPILYEAKSFYYLDKPYYNYRDTPFNITKKYSINRINSSAYLLESVYNYFVKLNYNSYDNLIKIYSHYFEMLWISLFDYFFYCKKSSSETDLCFLHTIFTKYKHWLRQIDLPFLKKIGILLFFWKLWHLLFIYFYLIYIFYTHGFKKIKDKFVNNKDIKT